MEPLVRRRKIRFSEEELCVLVEGALKAQRKLHRLSPNRVRDKAWRRILRKVNSVSSSTRTLLEVKKRWYDVRRHRARNIYHQLRARIAGKRGESDPARQRVSINTRFPTFIKEEPEELKELQLQADPRRTDRKLNGQLLPCVPMIKLEDIATHISGTALYSTVDLESLPECNSPQSNCRTSRAPDALRSPCTSEISNANSPEPSRNSEPEALPSASAVVAAFSAKMEQMNAACSAMLARSTQILSGVEGLTKAIEAMNYQQRYFHQRMLNSIETIAFMLKKHDGC